MRAALRSSSRTPPIGEVVVAGVRLTHPDRVLYPPQGTTKRDLALFIVAFAIAGCLMIWTINLSIDRLLYADWDRAVPVKQQHIYSAEADAPGT